MNTQSNVEPESPSSLNKPPAASASRAMYWSIRRELWENRSICFAPLAVAGVVLLGFSFSAIQLPQRRRAVLMLDEVHQRVAIQMPYDIAAAMIILAAFIVGVIYCLDALHGERRDRSVLFWKSMPVSDLTAVLSKASIPMLIMPPLIFVVIIATHLIMLLLSTVILLMSGLNAPTIWPQIRFLPPPLVLVYGLTVIVLWHAPIYAWLLLVSGWARRATFLWALLPVAIGIFERVAFGSSHFGSFVRYRLIGWFDEGFIPPTVSGAHIELMQLTPGKFLSTPGLWIGLAFAAGFLAAAVRLRRYRGPI